MNANLKRLIDDRPVDRGPAARERHAAVAGVLCAGVSLCTLASSLALDAASAMTAIGLAAFGLLLSFLCLALPWDRVGRRTVDLAPAAATLAIAIATTTIDPTYGFYLVLVAACIAYMSDRIRVIGLHLALIAVALVAPIVLDPEATRKALACALIFGPGVIAVSGIAIYMRRAIDARDAAYREFATDAMALATRIRTRVGTGAGGSLPAPELIEGPAPAPAIPLRSVGIAKVVRIPPPSGRPARRSPAGTIAIAASVVAAVATTAAFVREPPDPVVVTKTAPAIARDAAPRATTARVADSSRQGERRHRGRESVPAAAPATRRQPLALTDPAQPVPGGGGAAQQQPETPAPAPPPEPTIPTRPQSGDPQNGTPTPVQQAGPDGPVAAAVGLAEQTVAPLTQDLTP